jgi:hypothetical protein
MRGGRHFLIKSLKHLKKGNPYSETTEEKSLESSPKPNFSDLRSG